MTLAPDQNAGFFYQPIQCAPKDGTPCYLVYRDKRGVFSSVVPFRFMGQHWRSTRTGLPPSGGAELIGYNLAETFGDAR